MKITKGNFEGTKLDGLMSAATVDFPGPLHEGNGKLQPIIDERATPEQRQALFIMSGKHSAEGTLFHILSVIVTTIHDPIFHLYAPRHRKDERRGSSRRALETESADQEVTGSPLAPRDARSRAQGRVASADPDRSTAINESTALPPGADTAGLAA